MGADTKEGVRVPQTAEEALAQAQECARLASLANFAAIQRSLIELRKIYLEIAERLKVPSATDRVG